MVLNPLEKKVMEILDKYKIKYFHESDKCKSDKNQRLDFYLPDYDVYIEVKAGYTERSDSQLKAHEAVILIQDRKSIDFLTKLLI